MRVKCLAQEHNTMSPARARTRTARSGDERTNHEAIRLLRGFSNIIVGVVYQPPDATDTAMRDYLVTSLVSLEAKYLNCAIILAGDFNRSLLPMVQSAVKAFHLKPTVTFPTRGNGTLDQIFTNFPHFVSAPSSLPPVGRSEFQGPQGPFVRGCSSS